MKTEKKITINQRQNTNQIDRIDPANLTVNMQAVHMQALKYFWNIHEHVVRDDFNAQSINNF